VKFLIQIAFLISFISCDKTNLKQVNVEEFEIFVKETDYVTDAEKYGWSVVQKSVDHFIILYGIDWRCPDGVNYAKKGYAVTQVSYNDAKIYADWANKKIPSYEFFWENSHSQLPININSPLILPTEQMNLVGNVWEITTPDKLGRVRLAGGSYLCNPNTCNGSDYNRELFVDVETGNSHIGFAIY